MTNSIMKVKRSFDLSVIPINYNMIGISRMMEKLLQTSLITEDYVN